MRSDTVGCEALELQVKSWLKTAGATRRHGPRED
jgi:hypothetical protein